MVFDTDSTEPLELNVIVSRIQIDWIPGNAMVEPAAPSITESAHVPLPGLGWPRGLHASGTEHHHRCSSHRPENQGPFHGEFLLRRATAGAAASP
jgi:hypothetical protein